MLRSWGDVSLTLSSFSWTFYNLFRLPFLFKTVINEDNLLEFLFLTSAGEVDGAKVLNLVSMVHLEQKRWKVS